MKKKTNIKDRKNRNTIALLAAAAIAVSIALGIGLTAAYSRLKRTYENQCCVTDAGEQVEIIPGKILPVALFINHFSLTNGVNLAHIPFAELRKRILRDTPNLRDIKITRSLPNKIRIEIFERVPVVRVLGSGPKANANYTADSEGFVFWYPRRDTALLPIIRESAKNTSCAGSRLSESALAALRMLEEASDPEFAILKIQEVDTFKQDYLFATLADSSRAKIAWQDMDCDTKASRTSLRRQLRRLSQAMKSNVAAGTKLWNATDYGTPGRIYANDPTKAED